jgi:hypothetical protein
LYFDPRLNMASVGDPSLPNIEKIKNSILPQGVTVRNDLGR